MLFEVVVSVVVSVDNLELELVDVEYCSNVDVAQREVLGELDWVTRLIRLLNPTSLEELAASEAYTIIQPNTMFHMQKIITIKGQLTPNFSELCLYSTTLVYDIRVYSLGLKTYFRRKKTDTKFSGNAGRTQVNEFWSQGATTRTNGPPTGQSSSTWVFPHVIGKFCANFWLFFYLSKRGFHF